MTILVVLFADHALKWWLQRSLGSRALSLGALGEVRLHQAPIWLLRGGVRLGPLALWGAWMTGSSGILVATVALGLPAWSIALLLGGSLSHALEMSWRGSVADYIALPGWPAFDLADVALVVGASGTLGALVRATLGALAL